MEGNGGFIISSDRSDSGKTTITLGLMRLLSKTFRVVPFKIGPDFIDPMYHKLASGRFSVNLDLWIMGKSGVIKTYNKYSSQGEISIIEGVMGFYDGVKGRYSTWQVSDILKRPVILVIDCTRNSTTASAIIYGLKHYRKNLIKGVIFNKVVSESHYNDCKMKLPDGISSLGWIPQKESLIVGSRHLGLLTPGSKSEDFIKSASETIESGVDIGKIVEIAQAHRLNVNEYDTEFKSDKKAAIAYDDAFSFYYQDNLEYLRQNYELEFFSPLSNQKVNDASFIYFGGGYPELFPDKLEKSQNTIDWIKKEAEKGTKILAECGGMMYLSKHLTTNKTYDMTGIFDADIKMSNKLTIGYTELKASIPNPLSRNGYKIRGHEFHKSEISRVSENRVFRNMRGKGVGDGTDGFLYKNTLGLYSHSIFSFIQGKSF